MDAEDKETLQPVSAGASRQRACPTLTVVFHPEVARIGQRARLRDLKIGEPLPVSRSTPPFSPGDAALADPCLSRKPIYLVATADGGVVVDPRGAPVALAGEPLSAPRTVTGAELGAGVVLTLADRVVLLLHQTNGGAPPANRLGLVGENDAMEDLRRDLLRVADLDVPVLIRGETGTGKELVAQAIHRASARSGRPFVSVNMAAIPPDTAASELFGHTKGAFTGATGAHPGYFGAAEGGTLFLDEIGATPGHIQPMLLRVLESLEVQPLGVSVPRKVDVRVVAATDADLEEAIAEGSFRAAVFHRLEGYQLFVPPLRARRDDLGRLLIHFVRQELAGTGELSRLATPEGAAPPWLPAGFVAHLARLAWPGNVRQLRNVVRQFTISSRGLPEVRVDATLSRLLERAEGEASESPEARRAPGELSDEDIASALRENDHQIGAAATALGISRSALYSRIKDSPRFRQAKDLGADELVACQRECGGDLGAMARRLEVSRRALGLRMKELGLIGD